MTETTAERFARLQAKEQELKQREANLKKQDVDLDDEKPNNFPPCCPFMYHDLSDLPIIATWTIKLAFIAQFIWMGTLLINFIGACCTGTIKTSGSGYSVGKNVVFSIIYAILGVPLAFRLNYCKLYDQARHDHIKGTFFVLQALFIACHILAFVGLQNWGLMGVITTIDCISASTSGFAKAMIVISCFLWAGSGLLQIFLFGRIMILYKNNSSSPQPAPVQPSTYAGGAQQTYNAPPPAQQTNGYDF